MSIEKSELESLMGALDPWIQEMETEQESFWNSLTEDQRLMAFCAVARRIHKGDVVDRGTYRYVLYDVFGFSPESYMPAQVAGYMDIHNAICHMDIHNAIFSSSEKEIIDKCIAAVEKTDRTIAHTTYDLNLVNATISSAVNSLKALQESNE
jgi:hypothetical protein